MCLLFLNENFSITHVDIRFLKPLDEELLHEICRRHDKLVTVEDGTIKGGLGSEILEFISKNAYTTKVAVIGVPDIFIEHGTIDELQQKIGLDAESIARKIEQFYSSNT